MGNVNELLSRFGTLFGEPRTDSMAAFFHEYRRALSGYSDAVLEAAGDEVIREHLTRSWPTVAECVKKCREVAPRLVARPPEALPRVVVHNPTDAEKQRVRRILRDFKSNMRTGGT